MKTPAVIVLYGPGGAGACRPLLDALPPFIGNHEDGCVRPDARLPPGRAWVVIDGEVRSADAEPEIEEQT